MDGAITEMNLNLNIIIIFIITKLVERLPQYEYRYYRPIKHGQL